MRDTNCLNETNDYHLLEGTHLSMNSTDCVVLLQYLHQVLAVNKYFFASGKLMPV